MPTQVRPPFVTLRKTDPPMNEPVSEWLKGVINESKYVKPKLAANGVFDKDTAAETEELLYRLGKDEPAEAIGPADLATIWDWYAGDEPLPPAWVERRLARMDKGFKPGWGITQRSWDALHTPDPERIVRPLATAVSGGAWAVLDPEGQRGPDGIRRHYAIDWFGFEGQGTPIVSPIKGTVARRSDSTGNTGQVFGGTISIRDDVGRLFVFRHVDPLATLGEAVDPGEFIATVAKGRDGPDHTHHELYGPGSSDREYSGPPMALNPYLFYKGKGAI